MSIQAVAWALDQELPARPKLVLVSIANHASHTDGYCWLKIETIAAEASCSPRAVFNFIGDLVRNGFIRKTPRRGDDGKQRANDYWILIDRPAQEWIKTARNEETDAEDDDSQDVVSPHAQNAVGEGKVESSPEAVEIPAGACGPTAPTCSHKDSAEPSKTKPEEDARATPYVPRSYRPPPPPPPQPVAAVAGAKGQYIFAMEGTPAYDAWASVMAKRNGVSKWHATTTKIVNGESRRGWYFPSLFPPSTDTSASGSDQPPDDPLSDESTATIKKTG